MVPAVRPADPPRMVALTADGGMQLRLHPGQMRAWQSDRRFVAVIAGSQSGKTSFGPHWLAREVARRGPGDYMVVTPTFPLLEIKALPEFRRLFEQQLHLGTYKASPVRQFTFSAEGERSWFGAEQDIPTNVFFGYAADPESLESATLKAAWLDEAGQGRFRLGSWEAINRRLALHQGRALITTTPYNLGWLKQQLYDPWRRARDAGEPHPDIEVVNFPSTANPAFSDVEYRRARDTMPRWKFDLFYRGVFTRPAGLIYDSFDPDRHVVERAAIPDDWPRVMGLDFGGANTAAVMGAQELDDHGELTGRLILYGEYRAGSRTATQHVDALLTDEVGPDGVRRLPIAIGGSGSEQHWRTEFTAGGLPVFEPPVTGPYSVEVGIDRVYAAFAQDRIAVFADLTGLLEQLTTYSRKVGPDGSPTEEIEDKASFHYADALRYLISWLMPPAGQGGLL